MVSDLPPHVRTFLLLSIGFEVLAFFGTALGFGDTLRGTLILFGGLWPGLLAGADALFPGQWIAMFLTSVFLHGGLGHLLMNMIGLVWLGPMIVARLGARAFWPIVGLTALAAGLTHVMLTSSSTPVVGASGVLFGFLGIVAIWTVRDASSAGRSLRPLAAQAFAFAALNVALTLLAGGAIAWQAHLGGLIGGLAIGWMTWR